MKKAKIIGYWDDNNVPIENSNTLSKKESLIILNKIYSSKNENLINIYKGFSKCRICNKMNGNSEFIHKIDNVLFVIPQGYVHYLEEHNMMPDIELIKICL